MKPKFLILTINRTHHNQGSSDYFEYFKKLGEVVFYGPGFKNINSFNEITDQEYNFIISDVYSLFDIYNPKYRNYGQIFKFNFKKNILKLKKIRNFFFKLKTNNKIIIHNSDHYKYSEEQCNKLSELNCYHLCQGLSFWHDYQDIKELYFDKFIKNTIKPYYYNFIKNNYKKIIDFPWSMRLEEKKYCSFKKKKFDFYVPGVNYYYREIAKKKIKNSNYKIKVTDNNINFFIRQVSKFIKSEMLYLKYAEIYNKKILNSRICFTCGSTANVFVRKFLEIPFHYSLLLCKSFRGLNNAGFQNQYNFVEADLNYLDEQIAYYIENPEKSISIIENSVKLIEEKHTVDARARQLSLVFKEIYHNNFQGSYWDKGNFLLNK
ncbi:glycosyltransferase [Pelagibacteraceae bacterium]|nr:glycosyltransferase [Pelagibacteraceae bacterium]